MISRGSTVLQRDAMTKAELVEEVAGMTQLTKKHAEIIVNTVLDCIVDSLRVGSKIELRGFGSFRVRDRGARIGRNPKTGARVDVPAKRIPYFKPGKDLNETLKVMRNKTVELKNPEIQPQTLKKIHHFSRIHDDHHAEGIERECDSSIKYGFLQADISYKKGQNDQWE